VGAEGICGEDAAVSTPRESTGKLGPQQRTQVAWITAAALAVFVGMRFLPTGTNLNHMDFRVSGQNAIDFCDPSNPQFIPVVAVRSPVAMTVRWDPGLEAGRTLRPGFDLQADHEGRNTVMLRTANGKVIESQDLLVAHTRKLHLLIVDPTLEDYQHVHPEPGRVPGEWTFSYRPQRGGKYRVFADFTPAATGRGLYASADLEVADDRVLSVSPARPSGPGTFPLRAEKKEFRFLLDAVVTPLRAGQPADLKFSVARGDGGVVVMEPVMGAYAHLVAFDEARSGFAHLHPVEADLTKKPDAIRPELNFKITIPSAGRYVIWAQVNLDGREVFAPFWFEVVK